MIKGLIQFMVSKVSTFVINHNLNIIRTNLQNIFSDAINDKINFNLVKEKIIFD